MAAPLAVAAAPFAIGALTGTLGTGSAAAAGAAEDAFTGMSVPGAGLGTTGLGTGATAAGGLADIGSGGFSQSGLLTGAGDTPGLSTVASAGTSDVAPGGVIGAGQTSSVPDMSTITSQAAGTTAPLGVEGSAGLTTGSAAGDAALGLAAGPVAAGTAGAGSLGSTFANAISGTTNTATQNNALPFSNLINSLLGAYTSSQQAGQYGDLMNTLSNLDQWKTQAPNYYAPLQAAATQGIGNTDYGKSIIDQTMRADAARGYNASGNFITDAAKALNTGTTDYIRALTPLAMGNNPYGAATSLAATGTGQIAQNNQTFGNLGSALNQFITNPSGTINSAKNLASTIAGLV